MWVNRHQVSLEVYAKSAVNYDQIKDMGKSDLSIVSPRQDRFEVSDTTIIKDNDYEKLVKNSELQETNNSLHADLMKMKLQMQGEENANK